MFVGLPTERESEVNLLHLPEEQHKMDDECSCGGWGGGREREKAIQHVFLLNMNVLV